MRLEPLGLQHVPALWMASERAEVSWAYLRYGPFPSEDRLALHVQAISNGDRQLFFAVIPSTSGAAEGWLSYCDIALADAAIEIGSIWFSPRLQRTRAATEAVFLVMDHAFSLGFHRVVWRCNALNAASMRAALRFGFTFEGTWREAEIAKGRRRDTAWYSLLEQEWPTQRARFAAWLADANFDRDGRSKRPLNDGLSGGIQGPR